MLFKRNFLKFHLVINLLLIIRWLLLIISYFLDMVPVIGGPIGGLFIALSLVLLTPVSIFCMMFIGYPYLVPYIIYYTYLIAKIVYNLICNRENINKRDVVYIVTIFLSIVIIFGFYLIMIPDLRDTLQALMSV